jgi:hypothetical protein
MGIFDILLGVVFVTALGLAVGLGAMSDAGTPEFLVAKACFVTAALALAGAFGYWFREKDRGTLSVCLFGSIAGAWLFLALPLQLKWLDGRQEKLGALEAAAHPEPAPPPTAAPPLAEPVKQPTPKLQSVLGKIIYRCAPVNVPNKDPFKKDMKILGEIYGYSMQVTDVLGGTRLEITPVTATGYQKMENKTKVTIEARVLQDGAIGTYAIIFNASSFARVMAESPITPDSDDEKEVRKWIEKMPEILPGTCHLI